MTAPVRDGKGALAIVVTGWDAEAWATRFRALAPARGVYIWPDQIGAPQQIAYACAWKPPPGTLAAFPNLRAVFSLGAGVDHLLHDPTLPPVPIVRIVDPDLTSRMVEYVLLHVLMVHRRQRLYDAQQRARIWCDHDQRPASDITVGVMGLGRLGSAAASALARIGFRVMGWSRTPKSIAGVDCHNGASGLDTFLARSEILVVLLPLTPATEGLLDLALLRKLRRDGPLGGAHLINVGRGRLQIDADILTALDEGSLTGATLDVFPEEPLPAASPLWAHPRVTITPHNAAASDARFLVTNVLEQINRLERGEPMQNVIDRVRGY
jgi:glyoxylate/hydroxypyruvate reductase A